MIGTPHRRDLEGSVVVAARDDCRFNTVGGGLTAPRPQAVLANRNSRSPRLHDAEGSHFRPETPVRAHVGGSSQRGRGAPARGVLSSKGTSQEP
jgi:hypothetical protein